MDRSAPDRSTPTAGDPVVLYDGVCGLCHRAVAWLAAHDRERRLWFAPLQGETAARLRAAHPAIPRDLDSVVLVEGGRVHLRSQAFLRGARHLRWPWRLGWWLRGVPPAVLDAPYRLVARVRYRVFGRFEACRVPAAADRSRFLP